MIQREDIVGLAGTVAGVAVIYLGHLNEGIALIGAGLTGKFLIPQIQPVVKADPSIVTVGGVNYVKQPDGSLKPQ